MIKLPFKSKSPSESYFLTVDIGADAVKCLAFKVKEKQEGSWIAEIKGIGKTLLEPGVVRNGMIIDIEATAHALEGAYLDATENIAVNVNEVIFGLSGELCVSNMTTVKVVRGKEGEISGKEVDEIFSRVNEVSIEEAYRHLHETTGNTEVDLELITSSPVYTKLNEKVVPDLVGLTGQNVEMALFTAYTPSFNTQALQDLAKRTKLKITAIGSQMYSLVNQLKKTKGEYFDAVIIDLGSDTTDIGVVFGGGIVSTRSLPLGGIHFTKKIARHTGLSYNAADSKKQDYSYDRLNESEALTIQSAISETLELWLDGVELAFEDFTGVKTFASKVYLTGGATMLPDVVEMLTQEPWTKAIPFKAPPEFIKLSIDDLPLVSDNIGHANSTEYILPAATSIIYLEINGYL